MGTHYYAKVGHMEIRVDGEMKWNSEETTRQKALEFLQNFKKKMKERAIR
jgi:hypothetical protein